MRDPDQVNLVETESQRYGGPNRLWTPRNMPAPVSPDTPTCPPFESRFWPLLLRSGQSPYLASDNEDERSVDLIPLYLYEGEYLFARDTAGGLHVLHNDVFEFNLYTRYRFQRLDPGPCSISPFISWTWQEDNLSNYYFGVSESEATPDRPAHTTGESQWIDFGLNMAWQSSAKLVRFGNASKADYIIEPERAVSGHGA